MKSIYTDLKNRVFKHLENFQEDLTTHDKRTIKNNPGKKFIHITRKTGTHISIFYSTSDYPKPGERVKYLFSATANREELLKSNLDTFNFYKDSSPLKFHYFDGNKLHEINAEKADKIYKEYQQSILNKWEEQRQELNRLHEENAKRKSKFNRAQILEEKYGRA